MKNPTTKSLIKKKSDHGRPPNKDFRGPKNDRRDSKPKGFEDLLSSFMKDSDSKLKTIKKQKGSRRGNGYQTKR